MRTVLRRSQSPGRKAVLSSKKLKYICSSRWRLTLFLMLIIDHKNAHWQLIRVSAVLPPLKSTVDFHPYVLEVQKPLVGLDLHITKGSAEKWWAHNRIYLFERQNPFPYIWYMDRTKELLLDSYCKPQIMQWLYRTQSIGEQWLHIFEGVIFQKTRSSEEEKARGSETNFYTHDIFNPYAHLSSSSLSASQLSSGE